MVRFPNFGSHDVIIPGMANPSFNIDPKRALVSNAGRATVKNLTVKFEGNEILGVDDFDVFACYQDLWKTESKKQNAVRQGIIHRSSCTLGCMTLQVNASDKGHANAWDVAIANAYGNKFIIPLICVNTLWSY